MVSHLWYIGKFLQISGAVGFAVGATMLLAPTLNHTRQTGKPRQTVERKETKALPVKLPQGRLFCVKGVVMHERMHPRGFEKIAAADAIEVATTIADEACARSLRSSECKGAQGDLGALRRAIRSCEGS
jgi:hypothetical protein